MIQSLESQVTGPQLGFQLLGNSKYLRSQLLGLGCSLCTCSAADSTHVLQSTIQSLESQVTGSNYDKKAAQMQAAQLSGELDDVRQQLMSVRGEAESERADREASQVEMQKLEAAVATVQKQLAEATQLASAREMVRGILNPSHTRVLHAAHRRHCVVPCMHAIYRVYLAHVRGGQPGILSVQDLETSKPCEKCRCLLGSLACKLRH